MYIETSSPRQQGDNAKLNSPKLQFSGSMCLKFYYHMYGANIATLNVIIKGNNVFTASGNKGNKWLRAAVDVSLSGKHAVRDIIMPFGRCIVSSNCYDFAWFFVVENPRSKLLTIGALILAQDIILLKYDSKRKV